MIKEFFGAVVRTATAKLSKRMMAFLAFIYALYLVITLSGAISLMDTKQKMETEMIEKAQQWTK